MKFKIRTIPQQDIFGPIESVLPDLAIWSQFGYFLCEIVTKNSELGNLGYFLVTFEKWQKACLKQVLNQF